jgi:hypothetical protein
MAAKYTVIDQKNITKEENSKFLKEISSNA